MVKKSEQTHDERRHMDAKEAFEKIKHPFMIKKFRKLGI